MDTHTPAQKAIAVLGGPVATARALNIPKYQTVQRWGVTGIPAKYCHRVETLTDAAGIKVSRAELRPKDFAMYWPDLLASATGHQDGAPDA